MKPIDTEFLGAKHPLLNLKILATARVQAPQRHCYLRLVRMVCATINLFAVTFDVEFYCMTNPGRAMPKTRHGSRWL